MSAPVNRFLMKISNVLVLGLLSMISIGAASASTDNCGSDCTKKKLEVLDKQVKGLAGHGFLGLDNDGQQGLGGKVYDVQTMSSTFRGVIELATDVLGPNDPIVDELQQAVSNCPTYTFPDSIYCPRCDTNPIYYPQCIDGAVKNVRALIRLRERQCN
jgi:hypothetical protein